MSHSLQNAEKSLSVILINLVGNMKALLKDVVIANVNIPTIPKKYKCEYKEIPIDKELLSVFKKLKNKEENGQKDEFTGKVWLNNSTDSNVDECKLSPPIGKVFYREFIINC